MLSILSRSRAFGSARFTGLNALRPVTGTVADEEMPRTRSRGLASRAGGAASRRSAESAGTAVAVAEPETDDGAKLAPDAPNLATDAPPDGEQPRRHTTPEPGTAAERAAARRARMRQQRDDGGNR
jgi:preprotein translocase subunit SecD